MKIIRIIRVSMKQMFYAWAMREIHPLHPDVPRIMVRQRELNDEARRLYAA